MLRSYFLYRSCYRYLHTASQRPFLILSGSQTSRPSYLAMDVPCDGKIRLVVTVISDTVCPWCFLGKRRLEAAIKSLRLDEPKVECQLTWAPYFLTPGRPLQPRNKLEGYTRRLGKERTAAMVAEMSHLGAEESPPIRFSYGGTIANSMDSHRLLDWVLKEHGPEVQGRVVEHLSRKYFEQERCIGDHRVLVEAAEEAGANGLAAAEMLGDPVDVAQRGADIQEQARHLVERYNVTGVPHYVISTPGGTSYSIPGAQDASVFLRSLKRVVQLYQKDAKL